MKIRHDEHSRLGITIAILTFVMAMTIIIINPAEAWIAIPIVVCMTALGIILGYFTHKHSHPMIHNTKQKSQNKSKKSV